MNNVISAVVLLLLAVWIVRLLYAPVGAYTMFAMFLILLSMAYLTSNVTYVLQAELLYVTKA